MNKNGSAARHSSYFPNAGQGIVEYLTWWGLKASLRGDKLSAADSPRLRFLFTLLSFDFCQTDFEFMFYCHALAGGVSRHLEVRGAGRRMKVTVPLLCVTALPALAKRADAADKIEITFA